MGNMEGLVTLVFFKIKSTSLASWGILMNIFQKVREVSLFSGRGLLKIGGIKRFFKLKRGDHLYFF